MHYIFFQATPAESFIIKHCLHLYECASRQQVNYGKSEILFSRNTKEEDQDAISGLLRVKKTREFSRYLGLLAVVGQNKKRGIQLWWKGCLLSRAIKEVLLKTVVQAIPNSLMSVFLLPLNICDAIKKLMNKNW
ncbi:hypothetical protein P3X46_011097 [Hevea brasiliensis]|uniref:Reverse transcriptase domain-containing protein n=1 Tax=Hevea brasiliensis TaxID=3981 RepID=A0ABQ9MKD9_HEVBR|nr:hypothetical protein P3X46_011097 [Hevea brasiliensis]